MALAFVNSTTGTSDAGSTSLAATAANHTAGNLIVVGVVWSGNTTSSVPTDTAGNTYVSTTQKANNGTSDHVEVFYAQNIVGNATNVVTAHFSASSTFRRVMVLQFSGCDTTAPYTGGEGGQALATAATSVTTSSWATATADEALCAFMGNSGAASTFVAGSGYTKQIDALGTDSCAEYKIVAVTNTYTGGFSWTGSTTAWCAAASFKIAGGGGGGTVVKQLSALGVG